MVIQNLRLPLPFFGLIFSAKFVFFESFRRCWDHCPKSNHSCEQFLKREKSKMPIANWTKRRGKEDKRERRGGKGKKEDGKEDERRGEGREE